MFCFPRVTLSLCKQTSAGIVKVVLLVVFRCLVEYLIMQSLSSENYKRHHNAPVSRLETLCYVVGIFRINRSNQMCQCTEAVFYIPASIKVPDLRIVWDTASVRGFIVR